MSGQLLVRRLLRSIIVLIGVSIIVFGSVRLIPGDPARMLLPAEATPSEVEAFRESMGFNRPIYIQYLTYMQGVVTGDLGRSLRYRQPVLDLITQALPATAQLTTVAMLLAIVTAIPAGIISAVKRSSLYDNLFMFLSMVGQSVPIFWLGILLILLLSVSLHLLPTSGRGTWQQMVMPSIALATYVMALIARLTRSSVLEVLGQDYVRTARAKGLGERAVLYGHVLKNALIPVVTVLGLQVGTLLGGSVIVETIFAWPGIGMLAVGAIYNRDYTLVQGAVLVSAVIFVVINMIVDFAYLRLDPRIRYR